jgi:hypothetical protein
MSSEPPALPRAHDDDDDDVAWALQTAGVQWERGGVADAVVWLKRAAESAAEAGEYGRSADIQRRANEIDRWLQSRGSFSQDNGEDSDDVDELLASDSPQIEAGEMARPTASLVDALEAEARGELTYDEDLPVQDLGDLEDVEDVEAIDLDELEEQRTLGGYGERPLEEVTQARSESSQLPDPPPLPTRVSARPPVGRPSQRQLDAKRSASRQPASKPAGSRQPSSKPVLGLPLPRPKQSLRPPRPLDLPAPRAPFPSEPPTQPASERPPPPDESVRHQFESMPEMETDAPELPTIEPPTLGPPPIPFSPPSPPTPSPPIPSPPIPSPPTPAPPTPAPPRRPSIAARYSEQPKPPVSSAAPAELEAAVEALSETPPPVGVLDVALLAACRGLEDLPPETQRELAARARVEVLAPDQEVSGFGLALVTRGKVVVMPTIAEGACGHAARGEPVFSQGTLADGVPLRAVALAEGAEVAVWRPEDFQHVLATCPWVADELRAVGDRFQALAGAAMGPLGDRLDDHMRAMLTDRCEVRVLLQGDVLIEEGKPPSGLFIVGGGHLEVLRGDTVERQLAPGDLPFASCLLTHEKASGTVRAAAGGALVLGADRMTAHELIVSVPPLLELLSMV